MQRCCLVWLLVYRKSNLKSKRTYCVPESKDVIIVGFTRAPERVFSRLVRGEQMHEIKC